MSIYIWSTEIKKIYIAVEEPLPDYLCFTANTANQNIVLIKNNSPASVSLETSRDGVTWASYTVWDIINLLNVWDKVYFRSTSETTTTFSSSASNYYYFTWWDISASWDVTYLINKNGTDTVSDFCFIRLFYSFNSLTTCPKLPATTLWTYCYRNMFYWCDHLNTLPELPALTVPDQCYNGMFRWCTNIKLSETQTWVYQTPYIIPTTWTGTVWTNSLLNMFNSTWWTFTWTPTINTTYYTSNTLV